MTTTTWPGTVDATQTRTDGVDIVLADDFNYQDGQIRALQSWLGDGVEDLIGDDGTSSHGPGGLASPIADGGVAVTLAAKDDYTSGQLLSVGDNYEAVYSEKMALDFDGNLTLVGAILAEDGVAAGPGIGFASEATGLFLAGAATMDVALGGADAYVFSTTAMSSSGSDSFYLRRLAGSSSAPTYAFSGDTDTGIYQDTADTIEFACNATKIAEIAEQGLGIEEPGSESEPSIYFTADTDSGFFIEDVGESAFYIRLSQGGSTTVEFGTTGSSAAMKSPDSRGWALRTGTPSASAPSFTFGGDENTGMYSSSSDKIEFSTGATKRAELNVDGFGTVDGNETVPAFHFLNDPYTGMYLSGTTPGVLSFATDQTDRVSISEDGLVADPGITETVQDVTSSSNAVAVDCQDGHIVDHTVTENTTVQQPSNAIDGMRLLFLLRQTASNSYTVDFDSTYFKLGSAFTMPTCAASTVKVAVLEFVYSDSDSVWLEESRTDSITTVSP